MNDPFNLERFVRAQEPVIATALSELVAGRKTSHWMWFVFPQLTGLGHSPTSQFYSLGSVTEARAYLDHAILGPRLQQCIEALLPWTGVRTAQQILGPVDALKLRSSLTLFNVVQPGSQFEQSLQAFFNGEPDERTLALLNAGA